MIVWNVKHRYNVDILLLQRVLFWYERAYTTSYTGGAAYTEPNSQRKNKLARTVSLGAVGKLYLSYSNTVCL